MLYDRPAGTTRLRGYGRLIDDFETFLNFDSGRFHIVDSGKVVMDTLKRQAPAESKVLHVMLDNPLSFAEIERAVNAGASDEQWMSKSHISNVLKSLQKKDLVRSPQRRGEQYSCLISAVNSVNE